MPLEEYRRKRDFSRTAEPAPGQVSKRARALRYVIQKHDATRLHYDFRLELDGVLLSWAVPRGPSLDPAERRLAVRTEDHPVEYATFEGVIPEGEYGAGPVMLWDRGHWTAEGDPRPAIKKGHLVFVVLGERLRGAWDLIRMHGAGKRENWLLIKHKDRWAKSGRAAEIVEREDTSVATGRTIEEILLGASRPRRKRALAKRRSPPRTRTT